MSKRPPVRIVRMYGLKSTIFHNFTNAYTLNLKPNDRFNKIVTYIHDWAIKKEILKRFVEKEERIEVITVDQEVFTKYLYDTYIIASDNLYPKQPTHVYMGPDEFKQACFEINPMGQYSGFISFQLDPGLHRNGLRVGDVQVTVVPYMSGVLIV